VLALRESASRPTQGIVTIKTTGRNQKGQVVCTFNRSMLIPKRGQAVDDRVEQYR
jgi:itaconyl-CoA hydratase